MKKEEEQTYDEYAVAEGLGFDFILDIELEMERQGITREELANRLGWSTTKLIATLSCGSNLTVKVMVQIARALGCVVNRIHVEKEENENGN